MEGTALSLAKLTLETVLPVVKQAVANDALLPLGVRHEVSFITNELEMMQAFLRAADTGDRARDEVVRIWVQQVRDLAYDVEDCLQEYLVIDHDEGCYPPLTPSPCRWIRECLIPAGRISKEHRLAVRIREVKASVEEVSKRNLRYSIVVQPGPVGLGRKEHVIVSPTFAADVAAEESSLVGRDEQRAELIGRLTASPRDAPMQVLAVWAMGGMGKTVFVRDVLRSTELGQVFQSRAWVNVPRPFSTAEFLQGLVSQLDMETAGSSSAASANRMQTRAELVMHRVARHLESNVTTLDPGRMARLVV